jgi:hypothetical protein
VRLVNGHDEFLFAIKIEAVPVGDRDALLGQTNERPAAISLQPAIAAGRPILAMEIPLKTPLAAPEFHPQKTVIVWRVIACKAQEAKQAAADAKESAMNAALSEIAAPCPYPAFSLNHILISDW